MHYITLLLLNKTCINTMLLIFLLVGLVLRLSVSDAGPMDLELLSLPQHICTDYMNSKKLTEIHSALVCGKVKISPYKQIFLRLGTMHLMVVSGAHILFMQKILRRMNLPSPFQKAFILCFCLISGLGPAIQRVLIFYVLKAWNLKNTYNLLTTDMIFTSSLLLLLIQPNYATGFSAPLSCAAALGLSLSRNIVLSSTLVYITTFPIVAMLSATSPLSIVSNIIVSPVFAFLIMPWVFLSSIFPPLSPSQESMNTIAQKLLLWLPDLSLETHISITPEVRPLMIWTYLMCLFLTARSKELQQLKKLSPL